METGRKDWFLRGGVVELVASMDRRYWGRTFSESSRWLLVAALVYAPWAYGCTFPWASLILDCLLGTLFLLWLASCIAGGVSPVLARIPFFCALLLVSTGAFLAWNAHFKHDPASHRFMPIGTCIPLLPGWIDQARSASALLHIAAMLGTLLFVCDVARGKIWRKRLLGVMALVGASIAFLGLLQKATAAPMIFWQRGHAESPFFGGYYYHGNAGAFLNLVLPLTAALAFRSLRGTGKQTQTAIWVPALLVCLAATTVNVSRAASFISGLLACAWAAFEWSRFRRNHFPVSRLSIVFVLALVFTSLFAVSLSAGSGQAWQKWGWLKGQLNEENPRYVVACVCVDMIKDSGDFGFGPGTFEIAFPHYTNHLGGSIRGVWRFAHQDYLQTLIEWGWCGALPWALLLFGAILKAFFGRGDSPSEARFRFACGLALLGIAGHAMVDFPFQIASLQLYAAVLAGIAWSRPTCPHAALEEAGAVQQKL